MQLDKQQVRRAFSRAADSYDEAAVLQRRMVDEILERLQYVRLQPRRILDLGCGTGYAVRALKRRCRRADILGLDLAEGMLDHARRRSRWLARERWLCGDAEKLPLAGQCMDLIVCSATMQWCDLDALLGECFRVLRPDGMLAFASFGPDTLLEIRRAWGSVDDGIHVHEFIDMHDVGDALVRAGFEMPVLDSETVRLTYAGARDALRDVRRLGSTNAATGRARGLLGRQRFQRLQQALAAQAGDDGRLPVTYEIVYGQAFAPAAGRQRRGADGSVSVPLDRLRT